MIHKIYNSRLAISKQKITTYIGLSPGSVRRKKRSKEHEVDDGAKVLSMHGTRTTTHIYM